MSEGSQDTTEATRPIGAPTAHAQSLFRFGVITSVLYAGGLGTYAWFVRGNMLDLSPDQFATFLSGVFAPLAFLWLVLGFRQQGDELKNSARALWLQGEELRNSVEQQKQLVQVSREQLEAEHAQRAMLDEEADREAQPRLSLPSATSSRDASGPWTVFVEIANSGPTCTDAVCTINGRRRTAPSAVMCASSARS